MKHRRLRVHPLARTTILSTTARMTANLPRSNILPLLTGPPLQIRTSLALTNMPALLAALRSGLSRPGGPLPVRRHRFAVTSILHRPLQPQPQPPPVFFNADLTPLCDLNLPAAALGFSLDLNAPLVFCLRNAAGTGRAIRPPQHPRRSTPNTLRQSRCYQHAPASLVLVLLQ